MIFKMFIFCSKSGCQGQYTIFKEFMSSSGTTCHWNFIKTEWTVLEILQIFNFIDGGLSAILNFQIFKFLVNSIVGQCQYASPYHISSKSVKSCGYIALNFFRNDDRLPSWMFKNLIFWIHSGNMCEHAKFHAKFRSNCCWDIASFWSQKTKFTTNHAKMIFHPYAQTPAMGGSFSILAWEVTSLTVKFCVNWFRGFEADTPKSLSECSGHEDKYIC